MFLISSECRCESRGMTPIAQFASASSSLNSNCGEVVHMQHFEQPLGIDVVCMHVPPRRPDFRRYAMQTLRSAIMHVSECEGGRSCRLLTLGIGRSGLLPLLFPACSDPPSPPTTVSPPLDRSCRVPEAFHTRPGARIPVRSSGPLSPPCQRRITDMAAYQEWSVARLGRLH